MPTATPTENGVAERYYDMMKVFFDARLMESEKGVMYVIPEEKLQKVLVTNLVRAYELGKLSEQNEEKESGFNLVNYLCRD